MKTPWRESTYHTERGFPLPFTVRANAERFEELRAGRPFQDFSAELGVHPSTLSRIVKEGVAPGPKFIGSSLQALPYQFDDLFQVVADTPRT